jgi:lysophospholipase L1-like esterase
LLDCIILGDSIAVGLSQARPDCTVDAVSGITSGRYVQTFAGAAHARTAIISLGVNDGEGVATAENLSRLRGLVSANVVYWLLTGGNPRARDAVREVAARFGDRLIDAAPLTGSDHVHPDRTGYARLAAETAGRGRGSPYASPYRDFPSSTRVYRAFPGVQVWNGPYTLNGTPVGGWARP